MTLYKIANWNEIFETCETRKLEFLRWVPTPNKHDGLSFGRMTKEPDACQLFGAWNLILQVASKAPRKSRGFLMRDSTPLTAEDMAIMTGFPEKVFVRAFEFFSSPRIGWLEKEESQTPKDQQPPAQAGTSPVRAGLSPAETLPNGREGKGIEEKEGMECGGAHTPAVRPESEVELPPRFPKTLQEALDVAAFLGVARECAEMAYHKAVSRGGCDSRGNPIRSFGAYLACEQTYARNREGEKASKVVGWKETNTNGQRIEAKDLK